MVTVPLAASMVLAHTSKPFHTKVRFPKRHTLQRENRKTKIEMVVIS